MSQPTTIAHYRITAKLGEGGMGEIYGAATPVLNRHVATRLLRPAFRHNSSKSPLAIS